MERDLLRAALDEAVADVRIVSPSTIRPPAKAPRPGGVRIIDAEEQRLPPIPRRGTYQAPSFARALADSGGPALVTAWYVVRELLIVGMLSWLMVMSLAFGSQVDNATPSIMVGLGIRGAWLALQAAARREQASAGR